MQKMGISRSLLAALVVGLVIRVISAWLLDSRLPNPQTLDFPDSEGYVHLAKTIARGQPYEYGGEHGRIFRTPGYPLALSPFFLLLGDNCPRFILRTPGILAGVVSIFLANRMACHWLGHRVGEVTAWLVALDPGSIALQAILLSEAIYVPFLLAHVSYWQMATTAESTRAWPSLLSGAFGGMATLVRPSHWLLAPFVLLAACFYSGRRKRFQEAVWMLIGFVVVMSPWWARSYAIAGRFVPTSLQVGASLYDGLNEKADGASDMWFTKPYYDQLLEEDRKADPKPSVPFEVRLDDRLGKDSADWARSHPRRVVELAWAKFLKMWNPIPLANDEGGRLAKIAFTVYQIPLLILAAFAAWKRRADWRIVLSLSPVVYFTLLHMIFVSSIRYRLPAMPLVFILAADAICHWQGYRDRGTVT